MYREIKTTDGRVLWGGEAETFLSALEEMCRVGGFCGGTGRRIDWSSCDLSEVPVVPDIDRAILGAILEPGNNLNMGCWHGIDQDDDYEESCRTTHCRAGWAIHLAGKAGYDLERRFDGCQVSKSAIAGSLIYAASRPGVPIPSFYDTDSDAMDDLIDCAAANSQGDTR